MIRTLTPAQQNVLRRCRDGLRVWETGAALVELTSVAKTLCDLELVAFDDERGYEVTPQGIACLVRLGL